MNTGVNASKGVIAGQSGSRISRSELNCAGIAGGNVAGIVINSNGDVKGTTSKGAAAVRFEIKTVNVTATRLGNIGYCCCGHSNSCQ